MIRPLELEPGAGDDTWNTFVAASAGDVATLRRLLERNPRLSRAEYWYTPAIHFAAREGHVEAVRLLLDAGADPERNGLYDGSLIVMARDRGHEPIARILEQARDRLGRTLAQPADHPIHAAAEHGDIKAVQTFLDADGSLVRLGDRSGATALHRAVLGGARDVVAVHFLSISYRRAGDRDTDRTAHALACKKAPAKTLRARLAILTSRHSVQNLGRVCSGPGAPDQRLERVDRREILERRHV